MVLLIKGEGRQANVTWHPKNCYNWEIIWEIPSFSPTHCEVTTSKTDFPITPQSPISLNLNHPNQATVTNTNQPTVTNTNQPTVTNSLTELGNRYKGPLSFPWPTNIFLIIGPLSYNKANILQMPHLCSPLIIIMKGTVEE